MREETLKEQMYFAIIAYTVRHFKIEGICGVASSMLVKVGAWLDTLTLRVSEPQ